MLRQRREDACITFLKRTYSSSDLLRKLKPRVVFTRPHAFIRWPTTVTAKSFYSRQNQFRHGKINFITVKSFSLTAISISLTAKSNSSRQNHFHLFDHGKIILANLLTRHYLAKCYGSHSTWRSSSWFHDSTCIAQTVEIMCLQQGCHENGDPENSDHEN